MGWTLTLLAASSRRGKSCLLPTAEIQDRSNNHIGIHFWAQMGIAGETGYDTML